MHSAGLVRGPRRIAIVGGGFSGSSTAVQLVRRSCAALAITIIEPRERVGGGLAHSSEEPDHRLNGQPRSHNIDPIDEGMFVRWCEAHGAVAADPGARLPNDTIFMRRSVFRAFLEDTVAQHAAAPTGSSIRHMATDRRDVDAVIADMAEVIAEHEPKRLDDALALVDLIRTRTIKASALAALSSYA